MRNRRLIAIFIGVAGLLLIVVVALLVFLQSNQSDGGNQGGGAANAGTPGADGGTPDPNLTPTATIDPNIEMIEVVVAYQTVPRGWQMTEAELQTDMRIRADVGPNVITRIEDAVGLYARYDIYQGETLTADSLVNDPTLAGLEGYGPSSLIPQGWVAMSVPMDRLSGVAYGLETGDSVDVMLSFTFTEIDEQFQTLLNNSVAFYLEDTEVTENTVETRATIFILTPYGRFETLPTGDIAHVRPSENQRRPIPVSVILQNARIIQVGPWTPPEPAKAPTPTPDPNAPTPTPGGPPPTPTPSPPDVIVLALPPQEQLFLKYAMEVYADIDFAMRGVDDGQIYPVQNLDLNYLLQQFGIDIPPNFNYTIGGLITTTTTIDTENVPAP